MPLKTEGERRGLVGEPLGVRAQGAADEHLGGSTLEASVRSTTTEQQVEQVCRLPLAPGQGQGDRCVEILGLGRSHAIRAHELAERLCRRNHQGCVTHGQRRDELAAERLGDQVRTVERLSQPQRLG